MLAYIPYMDPMGLEFYIILWEYGIDPDLNMDDWTRLMKPWINPMLGKSEETMGFLLGGPVNCPIIPIHWIAEEPPPKKTQKSRTNWSQFCGVTLLLLLFYVFGVVLYVGLIDDRYN